MCEAPTVPGREERLATNEAYFREINRRVEERVKDIAGDAAAFNILCECARLECTERISVTPAEYEAAHANPRQFMVVVGHADHSLEDTVARTRNYDLVVKRGEAGAVAEEAARG
jgi:hypothetical protein